MFKWLADFLGVGSKPEPVRGETVRVAAPAAVQAPAADVTAKVSKPAAKAKAKPAAKPAKAATKKAK